MNVKDQRIEDLTRLQGYIRSLISMRKRVVKLSGAEYLQMTQRAIQKNGADLTWLGMDIDKAEREAHAAAVDCGLADPRSADRYQPVDYHPSSFHHYRHVPSKPRCMGDET
ncbi:hypothetical protein A8B82_21240 [Sulfitobacter sp. EhC04]|uniref:hypothetical protein n=1 Tax=Sulfitobacter sp. EhC04 TaxID=1849168 RepID=UPI0007F4ABC3|nr:hypothetical protein [Sulfitobacter sp. EhC04]OAN71120.1 hypothetical protein A8B82_21240 [Sulfitobacter sp. EhC04]